MGFQVQLVFKLTQHSRDVALMQSLIKYLACGNVTERSKQPAVDFTVTKFPDILEKIMPFCINLPLQGVKHLDFLKFVKVIELMKNKAHLTKEGLEQIREIESSMNRSSLTLVIG